MRPKVAKKVTKDTVAMALYKRPFHKLSPSLKEKTTAVWFNILKYQGLYNEWEEKL